MKKLLVPLIFIPLLAYTEEEQSFQEFNTFNNIGSDLPNSDRSIYFELKGRYDITSNANFSSKETKKEHLRFGEGDVAFSYLHLVSETFGYSMSLGYQNTLFFWKENPAFNNEYFHNGYFSFGIKNQPDACWTWVAEGSVNIDLDLLDDHSTLYIAGGWGRYQVNPSFATSIGFIARSGIRQNRFWPVLGIEWDINSSWTFNFVYPVNMSLIYKMTDRLSTALVARVFNNRHRLGPNQPLQNGIVEYRNVGLELALSYSIGPIFSANIHIGVAGEGDLKISDSKDRHGTFYSLDPCGYLGAAASLHF